MELALSLDSLIQGLTMSGIIGLIKLVWSIREQILKQNGRIGKLEQLAALRAETCDGRHEEAREESRMQWDAISRLQERP